MLRNDFVSNSSTSSFMIVGVYTYEKDKLKKIIGDEEYDGMWDLCEKVLQKTGANVNVQLLRESGYFYFGLPYEAMKKDETKQQFEDRILKECQKIFPEATKVECFVEAETDG